MNKPNCVETKGKTVEDAIAVALKELKVSRDRVTIEILSEEKRGLFGMAGAKLAKVRVTLKNSKEKT